jgi:hypothetical protein
LSLSSAEARTEYQLNKPPRLSSSPIFNLLLWLLLPRRSLFFSQLPFQTEPSFPLLGPVLFYELPHDIFTWLLSSVEWRSSKPCLCFTTRNAAICDEERLSGCSHTGQYPKLHSRGTPPDPPDGRRGPQEDERSLRIDI